MAIDYNNLHPQYKAREDVWKYNLANYEGGRAMVAGGYLHQSLIEGTESFVRRRKRSQRLYKNLLRSGLRVYQGQLFRIAPERKLPPRLKDMPDDVDLQGTDAQPFFAGVTQAAQITGQVYVLVDSPDIPEGATQEDVVRGRLRPYFEVIPTLNLIDWEVETEDPARRGEFNYIVIRDDVYGDAEPFKEREKIVRYRVWTRTEFVVYHQGAKDNSPKEIDRGENPLDRVPLVPFYDERLDPMISQTLSDDVALLADALWQYRSVRDESLYIHGIQQLVLSTDNQDIEGIDFSASRAIKIGAEDGLDYLRPSEVIFTAYADVCREIIEDAADLIFARTSRQLPTGQVESADKRTIDREEFTAILEQKASNFEEAERDCWMLANLWAGGQESDEVVVTYNRDFETAETLADEWVKRIAEGVASRVEWYQELHPGTSDEDALAAVTENTAQRGSPVRDVLSPLRERLAAGDGAALVPGLASGQAP